MTAFITQCPHCKTAFRASITQLESAEGLVRCGSCLKIFVADDNLVPSAELKSAPANAANSSPEQQEAPSASAGETEPNESDFIFTLDMEDSFDQRLHPSINEDFDLDEDASGALSEPSENSGAEEWQEPEPEPEPEPEQAISASDEIVASEQFSAGEIAHDYQYEEETEDTASVYAEYASASSDYETLEPLPESIDTRDDTEADEDSSDTSDASDIGIPQGDDIAEKLDTAFAFTALDNDQLFDDDEKESFSEDDIASVNKVNAPLELDWQERSSTAGRTLIQALIIILLSATLAGQYTWFNFPSLAQNPKARPMLEPLCSWLKCDLPPLRNIELIHSDSLLVRSHEDYSNALSVNLHMRNTATFAQAFPLLRLRFTDENQQIVAERSFAPVEYLPEQLAQMGNMPPSTPVQISFAILDPGLDAVNYEVTFD
ncbi:MAG: zinc-ribbon and DUF3426 domain-containing protein [Pseudohongiellaceae bacterium]|nr:zinc-ribbon and DUF3426 domain-containing protein [Pseudohongiellaceae bacterium]